MLRQAGVWSQQAYLKASNTESSDWFGSSVAVSAATVVVGAFRQDSSASGVNGDQTDNSAGESGAAYVFTGLGPECAIADFNCDGIVNGADLGTLLSSWGPCPDCSSDLNGDDLVNGADLGILLGTWG